MASGKQAEQNPRDKFIVAGQGRKRKQPLVSILKVGELLGLNKILLLRMPWGVDPKQTPTSSTPKPAVWDLKNPTYQ